MSPTWTIVADWGDECYEAGYEDALVDVEAAGIDIWTERRKLIYQRLLEISRQEVRIPYRGAV